MTRTCDPQLLSAIHALDIKQARARVKKELHAAALIKALGPIRVLDGWSVYIKAEQTPYWRDDAPWSLDLSFTLDDYSTPKKGWREIAHDIATIRKALRVTFERKVNAGAYIHNTYTGSRQIADTVTHGTATLDVSVSTGDTLPPSCTVEVAETRIETRTFETPIYKVVCK